MRIIWVIKVNACQWYCLPFVPPPPPTLIVCGSASQARGGAHQGCGAAFDALCTSFSSTGSASPCCLASMFNEMPRCYFLEVRKMQ